LNDDADYLARLAQEWNLEFSDETCGLLLAFVGRLMAWNARINLTGAKSARDLIGEHLVDSFAMTRFLSIGCSVVDVGAGGGLPGIPLAVLRPDIQLTMVEPRAKRVAFLRTASHELGLRQARILRCRCDELQGQSFDVCASRATFPPDEWIGMGLALARDGGLVLVFASQPWQPENPGMRLVNSVLYTSGSGRTRWIGAFCST